MQVHGRNGRVQNGFHNTEFKSSKNIVLWQTIHCKNHNLILDKNVSLRVWLCLNQNGSTQHSSLALVSKNVHFAIFYFFNLTYSSWTHIYTDRQTHTYKHIDSSLNDTCTCHFPDGLTQWDPTCSFQHTLYIYIFLPPSTIWKNSCWNESRWLE